MRRTLGIDLGTTNSVMATLHKGEPQIVLNRTHQDLLPSAVGRGRRGELLIGTPARARAIVEPLNTITSIKRFMGRKFDDPAVQESLRRTSYRVTEGPDGDVRVWLAEHEYTPPEISSLILRRLKEDAEARFGEAVTRAVITVPAYFGERQVAATREAGRLAGLQVLRIINEPTAAALAFGLNRQPDDADGKIILVYDLGGGTFDISILMQVQGAFTVLGIEGDNLLGGDDFDDALTRWLLDTAHRQYGADLSQDRVALQKIRTEAETVKVTLSSALGTDIILPSLGREGILLDLEVSRADFEAMIRERVERTMQLAEKAIVEAHLPAEAIDHVILVGGSTAIPLVASLLQERFGLEKIRREMNPMQCVALGAAVQTALLNEVECPECRFINSIGAETCARCSRSLVPAEKIGCPSCFMLSDAGARECWKCGSAMGQATALPPPQLPRVDRRCPDCGTVYPSGTTACNNCGAGSMVESGLKCSACGVVNVPGAVRCVRCGRDMPVTDLLDITAKSLGIELQDGRMSPVIPKGTSYPTLEPVAREYYTATLGQKRLEVVVREGDDLVAQRNELVGVVTVGLPDGLPAATPVSIGFGLDSNRMLTVSVKVHTADAQAREVRLERNPVSPEHRRAIEEVREEVAGFLDRWAEEMTDDERADFEELLERLDRELSGGSQSARPPFASILEEGDVRVRQATMIRGVDVFLTMILQEGAHYLASADRAELRKIASELAAARAQADWDGAEVLAAQADAVISLFDEPLQLILHAQAAALQNRLSPAVTHEVVGALGQVDAGMEGHDPARLKWGIEALFELWPQIAWELQRQGEEPPAITKLYDTRE